jgi:hypothetical protein
MGSSGLGLAEGTVNLGLRIGRYVGGPDVGLGIASPAFAPALVFDAQGFLSCDRRVVVRHEGK